MKLCLNNIKGKIKKNILKNIIFILILLYFSRKNQYFQKGLKNKPTN